MSAPTIRDLELFLGRTVGVGEATAALQTMTQFARAYTRGRGFTDGIPADDIAAVIVTATARLMANPEGHLMETVGSFSVQYGRFQGFNLLELAVLNNYRRTAA